MMNSVLIVDDSRENAEALRTILEERYLVYVALSGKSAMEMMSFIQPDIVLLDVVMPDIGGFDVLSFMRNKEHLKSIPVIFITAAADWIHEAQGLLMGAADYILKPYDPDIVSIKVKNHIMNKMNRDGMERLILQRTAELSSSRQAVIWGMSLLAEGRDQGTGAHIHRIQKYTKILAEEVARLHPSMLEGEELQRIILYAPMHDIGKVSIPDHILLKKGALTPEEFEIVKTHTTFGTEVLKKTEYLLTSEKETLRVAIEICGSHHEKYDGSGYPQGLKGQEIPISARIIALADVYDAVTSVREYKPAFSHEQAYDIIVKGDGRTMPSHFAPEIMEAFDNVSEQFRGVLASQ